MSDFDNPWKEALERYFRYFLAFFFPEIHDDVDWTRNHEMLDKELQKVVREAATGPRHVDKLVKVWRRDGKEAWVLVHVEVQSQFVKGFPARIHLYNNRLVDRYNRQVVSLAILADDRAGWHPNQYCASLWGCTTTFEFPVRKLLEYAGKEAELEADPNPFSVVALAHLKTIQTRDDLEERRRWKMHLVRGLYQRGWEKKDVLEIFRFIDWLMDLPPELDERFQQDVQALEKENKMPYLSGVERKALEKGREEGREQGLEKGWQDALLDTLALGLEKKFGARGKRLMPRLRRIGDVATLRALNEALWTAANLDDFRKTMP